MTKLIVRIAAIATVLFAQVTFAAAVELKVYSTIGVQGAVEQLVSQFEKASGHKLAITWGTAAMLVKRFCIEQGLFERLWSGDVGARPAALRANIQRRLRSVLAHPASH